MDQKTRGAMLNSISIILFFYMLITGIYLILLDYNQIELSRTYTMMIQLMDTRWWGLSFILTAIFLLMGVLVEYHRLQYIFFIVGGLAGMILMLIYAIASYDVSQIKILSLRYLLFVGVHFFVALMGVLSWKQARCM